jgi:hypothetical protein
MMAEVAAGQGAHKEAATVDKRSTKILAMMNVRQLKSPFLKSLLVRSLAKVDLGFVASGLSLERTLRLMKPFQGQLTGSLRLLGPMAKLGWLSTSFNRV